MTSAQCGASGTFVILYCRLRLQNDWGEELWTVEIRFRSLDGCPRQEMWHGCKVSALIEVAAHLDGFSFPFHTKQLQRYCGAKIPGEESLQFLKRAASG